MQQETVIVLDFGGQYNQLIARRVRECNVYCEIYSYRTDLAKIKAKNPKGIIFTGGPNSAYLPDSPTIDPEIYTWGCAHPGHLLWQPADDAHAGRPCHQGARAGIRQDGSCPGYVQPAVCRFAGEKCLLDEP